ncbi:MAG TPA: hypothetical protein VNF06_00710 [Candidatus Aquilonibacter sp.]|nr:hypothetical protein [Candidatus Aquilonibacter sp.]
MKHIRNRDWMQVISDRVRPHEDTYRKPWLNLGFAAGRASAKDMFEHGKAVFGRAQDMIQIATNAARNSGDVEMLRRVEQLNRVWQMRTRAGVMDLGLRDLRTAVGQIVPEHENDFSRINNGLEESSVNSTARALQGVLNPYARDIWGFEERVSDLDALTEESKQYANKSEAILMRPLWRRGLEWIWQGFGRGVRPRTADGQLSFLRETVNALYDSEVVQGNGEIGNWFEEYSHKTFIVHVLAKARETGSINGIRTTIENAISNPSSYASYSPGSPSAPVNSPKPPGSGAGAQSSEAQKTNEVEGVESTDESLRHFKVHVDELAGKLQEVQSHGDPKIKGLNYESIELIRSLNAFQGRISSEEEILKILDQMSSSFRSAAERSNRELRYVGSIGRHDFIEDEVADAVTSFREELRARFREGVPIFSSEKEIEEFFDTRLKEFGSNYQKRKELLTNLIRDRPTEADRPDFVAPVLF